MLLEFCKLQNLKLNGKTGEKKGKWTEHSKIMEFGEIFSPVQYLRTFRGYILKVKTSIRTGVEVKAQSSHKKIKK